MAGIEKVPLRFPTEAPPWFVRWYPDHIREVLAKADIRNAAEGLGISITSTLDDVATVSASEDFQQLFDADFALAESNLLLPNARTIAGEYGVVSVTDGGPGSELTIGIPANGLELGKLAQISPLSVLGNDTATPDDVRRIVADADGQVLLRIGSTLDFGIAAAIGGGTGFGSYTAGDLLYANSATTLAKLGVVSAGDVLRVSGGAPAWQSPSTLTANPTASLGLAAVNGSAATFMRSDAAPALSQAIAPVWTGHHQWTASSRNLLDLTAATNVYGNSTDNPFHSFFGTVGVNSAVPAGVIARFQDSASTDAGIEFGRLSTNSIFFQSIRRTPSATSGDLAFYAANTSFFNASGTQVFTIGAALVRSLSTFEAAGALTLSGIATSTTATAGANTLPSNPVGFITVTIGATARKIPYYAT